MTRSARIARLTPDSSDPEARAMARSPELMALLEASHRSAREPGALRSQAEAEADLVLTPEEEAEAEALAASWRAEDDDALGGAATATPPVRRHQIADRRSVGESNLSGRLVVRFPKSVHRELANRAQVEGVSLNQLILTYVARGLGADTTG